MTDLLSTQAVLCLTSLIAGVINSLAGGGTLLTFPALSNFVTKLVANTTNTAALVPGSLAGAWGYRRELKVSRKWVLLLLGPILAGGVAGALFLALFPAE